MGSGKSGVLCLGSSVVMVRLIFPSGEALLVLLQASLSFPRGKSRAVCPQAAFLTPWPGVCVPGVCVPGSSALCLDFGGRREMMAT